MSENTVLASCKKLHTDSEQQYYALVVTNLQQHSFDVAVTDGESAWRGTGSCSTAAAVSNVTEQQHTAANMHSCSWVTRG
jgi:type VI protein secretion system component VasA